MSGRRQAFLAATIVGLATFALYRATMLPGMDLGDTPSFQARLGRALLTPRDGYPLYSAIGTLSSWSLRGDAAHALNLASVVQAALACGVVTLVGVELTGSIAAAVAAALLFATSYTFWSQAIIAEVYALHTLFVALTLLLALRWSNQPTSGRLAVLFLTYAIGFGNHLSMLLLGPALAVFLVTAAPGGWRSVLNVRVAALAAACALAGAAQYGWNLRTLWLLPDPPQGILEGLGRFWFDVTKADWRETMVFQVPQAVLGDHLGMFLFDVRQQFGWAGPVLAAAGLVTLGHTNRPRALLLLAAYVVTALFALGYNVGDTHVFFLPSHLIMALLAAPGLILFGNLIRRPTLVATAFVAFVAFRTWRDYPALDRSRDVRPTQAVAALTSGLDDEHSVLLIDLNWQVQNGLSYYGQEIAPQIAYARMADVMLYAPAFVADNSAIDREVVLTARAQAMIGAAYGPLYHTALDPRAPAPSMADRTRDLPDGTRYVLCILKPTRDLLLDWRDIGATLTFQTGTPVEVPAGDYVAIAGVKGRPPALALGSNRPFRRSIDLDGVAVSIRMESWLGADTIRRMGFGHVIAARQHTLIVERGVSFVAFDESGQPIRTAYAANIFAPEPRYVIVRDK